MRRECWAPADPPITPEKLEKFGRRFGVPAKGEEAKVSGNARSCGETRHCERLASAKA